MNTPKVRIAIIGYGYWGPNLVRNFHRNPRACVVAVCDSRPNRLQLAVADFPHIRTTTDIREILQADDVDAVVVATPLSTHFALASEAIRAGKHVLVEKPLAASVEESEALIQLASQHSRALMVDHTFLYTGAVQKIKKLVEIGDIGEVRYFDSTRINVGLLRADANVLWDLATHDISIILHLLGKPALSVIAIGKSDTGNKVENIANMTVQFPDNVLAHINCSWTCPVKIRQTLIGGSKKTILYNDIEPSEKVKIYNTELESREGINSSMFHVDYRAGDVFTPKLDSTEALSRVAEDFVSNILDNRAPLSSAELGLEVVRILEAATKSIQQNGKLVYVHTS